MASIVIMAVSAISTVCYSCCLRAVCGTKQHMTAGVDIESCAFMQRDDFICARLPQSMADENVRGFTGVCIIAEL